MSALPADPFLAACRREPVAHTPVWFMRQAGRSLPEYRVLRGNGSILAAVRDPALAAEITMQPVRRYGVDAAILFSDIMVPISATGFGVDIRPGVGPVVEDPFRVPGDLKRLRAFVPAEDAPFVADAVRIVAGELAVPLIGFAGAPFTIASYLIEGGPSRSYIRTKSLMYTEPQLWATLLDHLADQAIASLRSQVAAGARAVQLFDSWAGALSPADYERYVLPASQRIFAALADAGVPRIHFGVSTGELLGLLAAAGADVVGVDWRVPLRAARGRLGPGVALQGNLDPVACVAGWEVAAEAAATVLGAGREAPGYIFNLGHGVLPETDPEVLTRLVDLVHTGGP
ncbi:MAG: uroporphyrinogen decarboxylase [Acidimicrobiales bacterium]